MKYKFAHFADVHWRGLSRHDEYRRSFEKAFDRLRSENVSAIFIVGDIVHSKTQGISPEIIDSLCWWFRAMGDIAPTYVTLGNHDGLILNKNREDAISPIIRAIDHPNLKLIKMTEKVSYDDRLDISNFSCFDEESWPNLTPTPGKLNLALFHGAVRGSKTDIDWEMEGEVEADMFTGYDFVFLGDIHKHQFLDEENRIAYCGSTIQQNFGETPDKGFLLWSIDDKETFSTQHILVPHDRPFVTVDWAGSVSETLDRAEMYPDFSRFRIRTSVAISQGEIKQLYAALKEFKNASEIVMKHDVPRHGQISDNIYLEKTLNLRDPKVVSSMIQKYFKRAGLNDRMNTRLDELVHRLWKYAIKADPPSSGKWSIKRLEFDNTFGYGRNNIINFDDCDGIVGIFGRNRVGKSSICGTLMYNLFNTTDRGSISNLHVINSRKGHCKTRALISKSGKNYLIERQTVKKQARSGKISATTQLNLLEIDDNEDVIRDMCGAQRRETEKSLRKIVGIPDDFLLTSFASQGDMNAFIKQKASARKTVLSKFLELDVFESLSDAAREEIAGVKQTLKNVPARDFDVSVVDLRSKLKARETERERLWESMTILKKKTRELELTLATRSDNNLVTQQDIDAQSEKIEGLSKDQKERLIQITTLESDFKDLISKVEKLESFKSEFPVVDLKTSLEDQRELDTAVSSIKHGVDKEKQKLKNLEKQVQKLSDVPCGDEYPVCQYIVSAQKAKKQLDNQRGLIDDLKDDLKITRSSLKKLMDQNLEEKLEKYDDLIVKHNNLSVRKSRVELLLNKEKNKEKLTQETLLSEEQSLDEMKANLSSDDAALQIKTLRLKLKSLKDQVVIGETKHATLSETIGLLQSDIQKLIQEKENFESLIEEWRVFELFLQATSKNGIPLEVIRSRLPEINAEIASVLQGVTGFTVELESDEGSNEMVVYINYGDSRRIIECCSGMEKMMSALAIRVALINVSALPKSDILIIDEGFGALDSANVEACGRFLESLKSWFKTILVISHVDAVKDGVDNVLEIRRKGPDAHVIFD